MGVLLASETSRIRIRSGSVVAPLHHAIRIAEEWSVVDNLSRGRVDLSFALGWHPDDFVLSPENYDEREGIGFATIETVRSLWRGAPYEGPNGLGEPIAVCLHPMPVQKELPVWLTCTGKPERFRQAGEKGFNVLTALIFQPVDKLAERIEEYRAARREHGLDPKRGKVTLMLHTYVGDPDEDIREVVREPLKQYLRSSVDLWRKENRSLEKLTTREDALEFAVQRYYGQSGLFGTVRELRRARRDVEPDRGDEIACLVDFGLDWERSRQSFERLGELVGSRGASSA